MFLVLMEDCEASLRQVGSEVKFVMKVDRSRLQEKEPRQRYFQDPEID